MRFRQESSFVLVGTSLILGMTEVAVSQNAPVDDGTCREEVQQQVVVTGTMDQQP